MTETIPVGLTALAAATKIFVTGGDGGVPVHNPGDRSQWWNIGDLWAYQLSDADTPVMPDIGAGKFIPNPGDMITDMVFWKWYQVHSIDQFTGVAFLKDIVPPKDPGTMSDDDILLGPGPGGQADTYRCYIDTSVMPFSLVVDARLYVGGTMCSYARIYRGSNLGPTGEVISTFFDNQGNLLDDMVPLEMVAKANATNYAWKTVMPCFTKVALKDGERVTVVFYSADDVVVSIRQLSVYNTAFIRTTDSSIRYVTGISLKSPFLSEADPKLIQYPINVPVRSAVLKGIVHYSDGKPSELTIDNNGKFSIFGLNNFVATIVGQELPLVLSYKLSADEVAYGLSVGEDKHISEEYRVVATKAEGSYSLKLYGYPVWIDKINGFRLEWFMYNLDRQTVYYVTPWVKIAANSRAFDPLAYGVSQKLTVNLNLKDVNAVFSAYLFTQTIEVVLKQEGDELGTPWTIAFDPNQSPQYGNDVYAEYDFVNYNYYKLRLDMGKQSLADWMQSLYYNAKPLTDPTKEAAPPVPNFFRIRYGNQNIECQISQWNQELIVGNGLVNNGTLFIEFFRRTNDNDLQLSVAGLVTRQTNP